MALIVTPGAPDANSYASVAEADAYHATVLYNESWLNATPENKEIVLQWATRLLDANMNWHGNKSTDEQSLRWPRFNAYDADGYVYDSDIIPPELKEGVSEYARILLEENIPNDSNADTFDKIKVASIELVYRASEEQQNSQVPDSVYSLIDFLGTRKVFTGAGNMTINQLSR